ncbi:hypothetical protein [Bosea psychrotolerans]|uniref:hypothetical protein n=1 Tax=Bosea psychrotolerans TaxID=1871628 RepID=UPI0015E1AF86|nr:hypothetical protein [Bosea psychrotolerans]
MSPPERRVPWAGAAAGLGLPGTAQTILLDDILFWNENPAGYPAWAGIDPALQR